MTLTHLRPSPVRAWTRAALAIGLACACAVASAAGWIAVMKNTAAEAFDEDDVHQFLNTAVKTLNAEGPPQTVDWSNPANGTGGSFLVVGDAAPRQGEPCKRLRVSVYAPKYPKSTSTWTMCRSPAGRWQLAGVG